MKSERKHILLRLKALLAAGSMIFVMSSCNSNTEINEEVKIEGSFYLVPYNNHIYMVTENHQVLHYDYRVVAYEGGSNSHEYRFYKYNGEEFGDGFNPNEVGFFHFEDEVEMKLADEMVEEAGQRPVSFYLNQALETCGETTKLEK